MGEANFYYFTCLNTFNHLETMEESRPDHFDDEVT